MHDIFLRPASEEDTPFALWVTEACMKVYAEQAWGSWDGLADFDPALDEIVRLGDTDIGLMGVERYVDHWFLDKLYLLPVYQNRGIGTHLLKRLMDDAKLARMPLRLTVLEVNPARHFYERCGFVLTHTSSPRHHMEFKPQL
jgi:GNAT superfamily N-acetyltransferase